MRVMPLVTRPCAWLLEPQLSGLQARPADGRPLSIGTEGQIDLDLAAFAYELAGIVGRLPNADAASEWERMTVAVGVSRSGTAVPEAINRSGRPSSPPLLAPVWSGRYRQTDMQLTLRVERQTGADFLGEIEYDHGALTEVAGRIEGGDAGSSAPGLVVVFSETRIVRDGKRPISLDGEYRASISGDRMTGGWFSGGVLKGDFVLVAGDKRQKQLDGDTVKKVPLSRRSPRE